LAEISNLELRLKENSGTSAVVHRPAAFEPPSPSKRRRIPLEGFDDRLGRIVAVSGSQAILILEENGDLNDAAESLALQIGSLVKMQTPYTIVFGIVGGLSIPDPVGGAEPTEHRIVELELLGEMVIDDDNRVSSFQRGVSFFPALGDDVFLATQRDLAEVYTFPDKSAVPIGAIHQDRTIPAYVVTDDLLGKHFAILGTTGAGKSCAVTLLLRAILTQHGSGHVVLMDMHNEYGEALGDRAEILGPDTLRLPYWLLNFEETEEIVLTTRGDDRDIESAILAEVVLRARRQFAADHSDVDRITIDTPVPYRVGDVIRFLDELAGRLDRPRDTAPYLRIKSRFATLQADPRFDFMFPVLSVRDNMVQIISQLFRVPVDGKPITIVDLSGVPSEIVNVVVSVLCRMTFDFAMWSERSVPVLLVCEEAHRYAPNDTNRGFEPTKRALAQIAKEGRKDGVSLCLVSQRPSELAPEILSQCNTVFALRMSNQKDQEFVRGAMAESGIGLMEFLSALRNAEAIAVGEGISVPMRLCFMELEADKRPASGTASFSSGWADDAKDIAFVAKVVERWRRQRR